MDYWVNSSSGSRTSVKFIGGGGVSMHMALATGMLVTIGTCGSLSSTSSTSVTASSLCKRPSDTLVKCIGDSGGVIGRICLRSSV